MFVKCYHKLIGTSTRVKILLVLSIPLRDRANSSITADIRSEWYGKAKKTVIVADAVDDRFGFLRGLRGPCPV
jgi:hypothetical protein